MVVTRHVARSGDHRSIIPSYRFGPLEGSSCGSRPEDGGVEALPGRGRPIGAGEFIPDIRA